MGRKKYFASAPLQKIDDALTVEDIIKDDAQLIQVHFIASLMTKHMTIEEMQLEYSKKFGEEIGYTKIKKLKALAKGVYLAEISKVHDELVAEELMHAEWELRELQDYWEKSKKGRKKTVHHKAVSEGTELTTYDLDETTTSIDETFGDLEAMKRINAVRERMIKVLGLEAPKKPVEDNNKINAITINVVGSSKTIEVQDAEEVK
jgi:hypothetical protein